MDIIAGTLLLVANILFATGMAFESLFVFLGANLFFLFNSIVMHSYFGAFTIFAGILAQIYILYNMIKGQYLKNLKKGELNE